MSPRGAGADMTKFETFGDAAKSGPDARMECRICWYIYDPAEGDVVWQIPPGTPFAQLPQTAPPARGE